MDKIQMLKKYIDNSDNIVFFGGAGVSTESGIKDFRSVDGIYNELYEFPPEKILSKSFFYENTEYFYKFYREKLNTSDIEPNIVHKYLVDLENSGKLKAIITQNIDGLHEKAGSKNVILLHGSINSNHCIKCNKNYNAEYVFNSKSIPKCSCGGIIKPNVILYEEELDDDVVNDAITTISKSDLLIVAGTSLVVYPAASFIRFFKGKHLVIINNEKTNYDSLADLVIHDKLGNVVRRLTNT